MGRRQKWLSIELERYAEVLALFERTYFCIDVRRRGGRHCFGMPTSHRSAQLAENSCSFEAACTFSWPHFVLRGSWDRGGISCITVALPPCVFLWFHLYSLHYRGPSVWLDTTHSLTCQITSAFRSPEPPGPGRTHAHTHPASNTYTCFPKPATCQNHILNEK